MYRLIIWKVIDMTYLVNLAVISLLSIALGLAQTAPTTAQEAVEAGEIAMQEALNSYNRNYPDQPLWREAIGLAKEAVRLEPERPEPLRFLAEVYSRSNWYGPAYQTWQQYLDAGGELDSEAAPLFTGVSNELGYTAYSRGDLDRALEFYLSVVDTVPYDTEAYVWAGRILLETGRPEEAIPYWETVAERDGGDERSEYFLELARDQVQWGVEAVTHFREGIQLYEDSETLRAREKFAQATVENQDYAEAWAWLGRTAFEMGDFPNAQSYYESASSLEPTNETYSYFYNESQRRGSSGSEN